MAQITLPFVKQCQAQLVEGHSLAEFSSNLLQHLSVQVILKTLIQLELELKTVGLGHP